MNEIKRLYSIKFKGAYTHRPKKNKEKLGRVHERKFQSSRLMRIFRSVVPASKTKNERELIIVLHSLKEENQDLIDKAIISVEPD